MICDGPDYASYFRVLRVDPRQALVYRSIRHPRRGSPIDITDPQAPQRVEQQLREAGTYIDFTWALVLIERPGHGTRLLVRTRANYSPRAIRLLTLPGGLVDATYGVAHAASDRQARRKPRPGGDIAPPREIVLQAELRRLARSRRSSVTAAPSPAVNEVSITVRSIAARRARAAATSWR